MAATCIFTNIAKKWIYTHENLWQYTWYSNIVLFLCLQATCMFLAAIFSPLHGCHVFILPLTQCCFHHMTPNICALYICENNFCMSYYFEDIINGRGPSLFWTTLYLLRQEGQYIQQQTQITVLKTNFQ